MSAICKFCKKATGTLLAECGCGAAKRERRVKLMEADMKEAVFMLLDAELITLSRGAEMLQIRVMEMREMLRTRALSTQ